MSKSRVNGGSLPTTSTMLPMEAKMPATKRGPHDTSPMTPEEKKARAEELKHEPHDKKFQRLAIPRVNKAIKAIRQLGSLANRSAYAYTDEQVVKLLDAIKKATADVQARFQGNKDNGTTFSF